jgi:hypothetical protein
MRPRVLVAAVTLVVLAVAGAAHALDEIPVTIENNRLAPEELKVKAGAPFVIVVTRGSVTS